MAVEADVTFDSTSLITPTVYVNRFHVSATGELLRIAFAEGMEGKDFQYRTAVIMTIADARELSQVLSQVIETHLAKQNA